MPYLDGYLAPVPESNRAACERLARISVEVLMDCGALRIVECWPDEAGPLASSYHGEQARRASTPYAGFVQAAGVRAGETVVMSFVEWPDRPTRDAGMEKLTRDPRMQFDHQVPAFDGRRLVAAGFKPMLDSSRAA